MSEGKEQIAAQENKETIVPWGLYTFDALDLHRQTMQKSMTLEALAWDFRRLVDNVMSSDEIEIGAKATAISALADEFKMRVSETLAKERCADHYDEVEKDCTKAGADEFAGGCKVCGFGTKDAIKAYGRCPFCGVENADSARG